MNENQSIGVLIFKATFLIVSLAACQSLDTVSQSNSAVGLFWENTRFGNVQEQSKEIIGVFRVENNSTRVVCFHEDLLINPLSPYVGIRRKASRRIEEGGLPHPPRSSKIRQLFPGSSISFERILEYTNSQNTASHKYLVSVSLWDCETDSRINKQVTVSQ
ncbi:hypothetical protein [Parasphingorhabdus sp.]|uniref:hypothetical protein n=1 Tax=Parasphingorhabdus sp. TaxID=2709688 RepID=UPI003BB1B808